MRFNKDQTNAVARYLADFSKILVASVVIGFFIPSSAGSIPLLTFIMGTLIAGASLVLSVRLFQ